MRSTGPAQPAGAWARASSVDSRSDTSRDSVACPLGKVEKPGVAIIGWMRGDSSHGRARLKISLTRCTSSEANITAAAISSSVQGVRCGLSGRMPLHSAGLKFSCARISALRAGRRLAIDSTPAVSNAAGAGRAICQAQPGTADEASCTLASLPPMSKPRSRSITTTWRRA